MERAYDWISHDPDFLRLKDAPETFADFGRFLEDQRRAGYPAAAQPDAGSSEAAAGMIRRGAGSRAVTETLSAP